MRQTDAQTGRQTRPNEDPRSSDDSGQNILLKKTFMEVKIKRISLVIQSRLMLILILPINSEGTESASDIVNVVYSTILTELK